MNSSLPVVLTVNALPSRARDGDRHRLGRQYRRRHLAAGRLRGNGYIVSRGGTPVATVAGAVTNYLDFNVAPNTTYCYSVVATNATALPPPAPPIA